MDFLLDFSDGDDLCSEKKKKKKCPPRIFPPPLASGISSIFGKTPGIRTCRSRICSEPNTILSNLTSPLSFRTFKHKQRVPDVSFATGSLQLVDPSFEQMYGPESSRWQVQQQSQAKWQALHSPSVANKKSQLSTSPDLIPTFP